MRITDLSTEPIHEFEFLNAGRRPGDFSIDRLPVLHGRIDALPDDLDAILFCADLQGREPPGPGAENPPRLIGEAIPELIQPVLESLDISLATTGTVLAGDFFTYPDLRGRGGTGDVTSVWDAFQAFRWTVGVGGNHDTFDKSADYPRPTSMPNRFFLDATSCCVDGIRFNGLSGVIGNPRKNFRRTHVDYIETLELLFSNTAEIGVLHEGPNGDTGSYRGIPEVREVLERCPPCLIVRGHKHWPDPLIELRNGTQVLNVECTIVIVTR